MGFNDVTLKVPPADSQSIAAEEIQTASYQNKKVSMRIVRSFKRASALVIVG